MPKFEFSSGLSLRDALADMGMSDAFNPTLATFSRMSDEPLFISDVVHEAFVAVDEAGTEAAAATAVVMTMGASEMPSKVSIDQPFIFLIRDMENGSILFVGRVIDPSVN